MQRNMELTVDGKKVLLNAFAATALTNVIRGFLKSLRDTDADGDIVVKIARAEPGMDQG